MPCLWRKGNPHLGLLLYKQQQAEHAPVTDAETPDTPVKQTQPWRFHCLLSTSHMIRITGNEALGRSAGATCAYIHAPRQNNDATCPAPLSPPEQSQAQHMVVDMVALGVSATTMFLVRNSTRGRMLMPVIAFPLLAVAGITATYYEMKSIELRTLNRERAEMVANEWIASGRIPSTKEVSDSFTNLLTPSAKK